MRRTGIFCLLITLPQWLLAGVAVTNPRCENLREPLGIDTDRPRFSWQLESDEKNVVQTGYEISVRSDRGELWNSGRVESAEQLWITYGGKPLRSNEHCTWQVRVFTNRGDSGWSQEQQFSTGLLGESKWSGRWIGLAWESGKQPAADRKRETLHTRLAARYLRHEFELKDKAVKRATAFVAGLDWVSMSCMSKDSALVATKC